MTLDSALGGMWVALMQFNLLPSVLLVTMLCMDKIVVGGLGFLLRTFAVLVATCFLVSAMGGFRVEIDTPMSVIVACLPFMVAYPLAISNALYALARKVARQNQQLVHLNNTDLLTGLPNRRHGLSAAEHALARHRRYGRPAALVVIDIDRFKGINDRYGHPVGDQVLRDVATMLRQCSRVNDTPARYGGDEFLLVLPDTDLPGAADLAQRIREELAASTPGKTPGLRCTVSLGAAEAYWDMADAEDWIQQADAALYRAKAAGRDRLVCAPTLAPALDSLAHAGDSRLVTAGGDGDVAPDVPSLEARNGAPDSAAARSSTHQQGLAGEGSEHVVQLRAPRRSRERAGESRRQLRACPRPVEQGK